MNPHDDPRELHWIKNADNQKKDVTIQQQVMKSMSNGTHGVQNCGCWNLNQYNAQWEESNQVSLNTSQYNVRGQD